MHQRAVHIEVGPDRDLMDLHRVEDRQAEQARPHDRVQDAERSHRRRPPVRGAPAHPPVQDDRADHVHRAPPDEEVAGRGEPVERQGDRAHEEAVGDRRRCARGPEFEQVDDRLVDEAEDGIGGHHRPRLVMRSSSSILARHSSEGPGLRIMRRSGSVMMTGP